MRYIKKASQIGALGLGALLAVGLSACQQRNEGQQAVQPQEKNAFVVIEEVKPGKYKIAEEFPAKETRIILKKLDGTEKVLTRAEMDALIKKEEAKIENGTSPLTSPEGAQVAQQGGLSLGEAILASAAGAIIGSWIGSKLFNNPNYRQNRRAGYKTPSAYNRSVNSFKKGSTATRRNTTRRSGFFGGRSGRSGRSGFFGG
ncbi:UPF0323 family lipoprotein [Nitratifractor salsuginis]|uniref:UPF0323 domain-containing protein n=1 Tax=Nitratifractor salsuginis (strain DSM 16511 / JCM 12458 / E9I37-1) TaxID=749222 RepID=E6WZP3_NITSE|nr:UPF0323 family lipoprotein [Nitratifractor salsuginis]ADV46684.1 hypothetical protein Nitsa_1435 [Nitratifractor salsuginis DSM 16511]